jgi:hypothetical protein
MKEFARGRITGDLWGKVWPGYFIAAGTGANKTGVAQVSKPAVSPISKSADRRNGVASAGLETRDTADLEVCATGLTVKYPG